MIDLIDARPPWWRRRGILPVAAICLAAVVPYLSTIHDYFVRDDFGVVQLLASKPATWFPRWFWTSWMENIWGYLPDEIRPFPAVSYQITALWGAASPVGHHLLNIALHAANGVLVYAIARRAASLDAPAAALAGLVFVLLPVHTESVAWITGRVDSMPAFFYLASFLAYVRWRAGGPTAARDYVVSVFLFFVALFTKQNTITMIATLGLYDLLIGRAGVRVSWSWLRPYVPFVLLTAAYLWLRYLLFGEVAREGSLGGAHVLGFVRLIDRHLAHVVAGRVGGSTAIVWLALAAVLVAAASGRRSDGKGGRWRKLLFFGPAWWLIGVAPIAVAGYESPRHVYLAAVGWAICVATAADTMSSIVRARARLVFAAASLAVLIFYAVRLQPAVGEYNAMSAVSQRAVRDVTAETLASPPGTLIIAGAPPRSWEWALPFAVQPPFTRTNLMRHAFIISPRALHCCTGQWFADTRRSLSGWASGPSPDSGVVLRWDARTGALSRVRVRDNPAILVILRSLLEIQSAEALDINIRRVTEELAVR